MRFNLFLASACGCGYGIKRLRPMRIAIRSVCSWPKMPTGLSTSRTWFAANGLTTRVTRLIKQTCEADFQRYGGTVLTYIEQEGGGDGKTVMEQMIRMLGKYPVFRLSSNSNQWKIKGAVRLPGDAKVRRALPFAAQCEAGNVRILANARWSPISSMS